MRVRSSLLVALVGLVAGCGSPATPTAAGPATPSAATSPAQTPSELNDYDNELLAQLKGIDFQVYETAVTLGGYVFNGAGLNYDHNVVELGYGGLVIDEWKAVNFQPASGKCSTEDPRYAWNCTYLATSPNGNKIYAGPVGGLSGYPPDLGDVYVELGSTVHNIKGATGHVPTLADLEMFADALQPATPEQLVRRNQQARDYAAHLQDTVASRIDFKTYLPQKPLQNFTLDRKYLGNPSDPLHPYLDLHFRRVAVGNQAFEFTVAEFRDNIALSTGHCGLAGPEFTLPDNRCSLWFTTQVGVRVYSTYASTRFDRSPTRIVINYSADIHKVTKDEMQVFIDSFVEVPPASIN